MGGLWLGRAHVEGSKNIFRGDSPRLFQGLGVRRGRRLPSQGCARVADGIGHRRVVELGKPFAGKTARLHFDYCFPKLAIGHAVRIIGQPTAAGIGAGKKFADVKPVNHRGELPVCERFCAVAAFGKFRVENDLRFVAEGAAADAVLRDEHRALFVANNGKNRGEDGKFGRRDAFAVARFKNQIGFQPNPAHPSRAAARMILGTVKARRALKGCRKQNRIAR